MAFIYFSTRGESVVSLKKTERPRGTLRLAQIVVCEVKKVDNQEHPWLDIGGEEVLKQVQGFLPFLGKASAGPEAGLKPDFVLLI